MYCNRCGCEIKGNGKFCPKCGNQISNIQQDSRNIDRNVKNLSGKKKWKKWIAVIVSICILATTAGGIALYLGSTGKYLAPVKNEMGKIGYINEKGEEVIECQFDVGGYRFGKNGVAVIGEQIGVGDDGHPVYRYGCIDKKGKMIVECKYNSIENFEKSSLARVAKSVGKGEDQILKYGYINEQGKEVIPVKYDSAEVFSKNGLACIGKKGGEDKEDSIWKYGYINERGEEIIPVQYGSADSFSENGLACVGKKVGEDENGYEIWEYGYVNEQGKEVIPIQYEGASDFFENGLARVGKRVKKGKDTIWKYGYINEQGEEIIPMQYDLADSFSENGLACVGNKVGEDEDGCEIWKYGYINEQGEEIIPMQYDLADFFSENGLALVGMEIGKAEHEENVAGESIYDLELINERGKTVIDSISSGSCIRTIDEGNGLFCITNLRNKIFDKTGHAITTEEFDYVNGDYGDNDTITVGNIIGELNDTQDESKYKCKYIDTEGKTVMEVPDKYIYAGSFVKVK